MDTTKDDAPKETKKVNKAYHDQMVRVMVKKAKKQMKAAEKRMEFLEKEIKVRNEAIDFLNEAGKECMENSRAVVDLFDVKRPSSDEE
ncbi:hypothetical protein NUU61_007770 [Penicillium alfredii]|uniref:Uncharacterized protein n=1 Tax=Penicillium alfredii TaxID=1506179 RepID=A0A9W9ER36_9EURO|nr:uncharacterized protein NUU61_007770 [Penicillium alfredii]KAJ5086463.1 hypothetical protein NUU61_007770 [Penicillium alfredii]